MSSGIGFNGNNTKNFSYLMTPYLGKTAGASRQRKWWQTSSKVAKLATSNQMLHSGSVVITLQYQERKCTFGHHCYLRRKVIVLDRERKNTSCTLWTHKYMSEFSSATKFYQTGDKN